MLDHDKAMKLWNQIVGKSNTRALDYQKLEIRKESYGDCNSYYGWEIHHKIPHSRGGTDAFENLVIVHYVTHDEIHGR